MLNAALVALAIGNSACAPGVAGKPADPKVWYTADSLALRDGEAVSTWPDTSANGHDATATEGNRPSYRIIDGVPLVHFDGVDDYMIAGTAADWTFLHDGSDWTIFVVLRTVAGELGGTHVLLDSGGADSTNRGFAMSYDAANGGRDDAIRVSVAQGTPGRFALEMTTGDGDFPAGQWGIVAASSTASDDGSRTDARLFVNGHQKVGGEIMLPLDRSSSATELNIGRYGLGNTLFTNGDIKEIVIYDRVLSEAEHYAVIEHLATSLATDVRIRYPSSRKWLSYDPAAYQAFGIAFRIPSTGKLMAIQRQGTAHVGGSGGEVRTWESTDLGSTWTSRLAYDSQYDDRNVAGGRVRNTGSILVFFARYDGVHWIDMRALRSVDDAQTFNDIGAPLPTNGVSDFSPYGPMVELPSGRLLQTFYGGTAGMANKVWVSESVDDGRTWTYKADIYRGPLQMNETSLAWISGSDDASSALVAVSRNDGGAGLFQFLSTDGGSTWTSQGLIPDGDTLDLSPWLYRTSGGMLVLAWHERTGFTFPIRVAPASAVAAGPGNWGAKQVTYRAVTNVMGASGYPALLSATGWDDDLIEVIYDSAANGKANLLINPVALP